MISDFSFSLQGLSHKKKGTPCQDCSATKQVQIGRKNYVLSAIADGVGSCDLSGEGAEMAVRISIWYLENYMVKNPQFTGRDLFTIMGEAFENALKFINTYAERNGKNPKQFSTTLTATVYDGDFLLYGHCGDGGIVTMSNQGNMQILTERNKGEFANETATLQRKIKHVGLVNNVVAFAMMTDGVLDAYVRPERFENRIYGDFFANLFQGGLDNLESIQKHKGKVIGYLNGEEFRKRVDDDITLACIINQDKIKDVTPQFDERVYNEEGSRIIADDNMHLYGRQKKYDS